MEETLAVAINRPRLLVGIDKRLFAGACLVSFPIAIIGDQSLEKFAIAILVFLVSSIAASRLTKWDPDMMSVLPAIWRQKKIYDPGKRAEFRVKFTGQDK